MGCQNEASFDKLVSSIAGSNNPQNEGIYDKGHCWPENVVVKNLVFQ